MDNYDNSVNEIEDNQLVIFDMKNISQEALLGAEKTSAQHEFF